MENWITETFRDYYKMSYRFHKKLFSQQSKFQKVEIYETTNHGRMLLNDDLVMVSERDEFVYHEMIAHVPLFVHPNPRRVLVIGGGDGGTLREVIRHPTVEKCTMVEIDEIVVNACKEFIPVTSSKLNDPKAELLIEDGVKFVKETKEKFDVVIIDSTDPIGPAAPLFGPEFYQNVNNILNDDGIVVSQAESPYYETEAQTALIKVISQIFPKVNVYNFSNLTYPGGLWSFSFGSKKYCPVRDFDAVRVDQANLEMRYYNKHIHTAAFQLPTFMFKNLQNYLNNFH